MDLCFCDGFKDVLPATMNIEILKEEYSIDIFFDSDLDKKFSNLSIVYNTLKEDSCDSYTINIKKELYDWIVDSFKSEVKDSYNCMLSNNILTGKNMDITKIIKFDGFTVVCNIVINEEGKEHKKFYRILFEKKEKKSN